MYWGDYLRDTAHLTAEEHGAYLLLIAAYWARGKPLPDDDAYLAQVTKLSKIKWKYRKQKISEFFFISDGVWRHDRVEKELVRSSARTAAGVRANSVRWSDRTPNHNHNYKEERKSPLPTEGVSDERPTIAPNGSVSDGIQEAFEAWNAFAAKHGLPECQKRTKGRISAMRARLRDAGGLPGWLAALERAGDTKWMLGDNQRGWKLNIDSLLGERFFTKLMEGAYDHGDEQKVPPARGGYVPIAESHVEAYVPPPDPRAGKTNEELAAMVARIKGLAKSRGMP